MIEYIFSSKEGSLIKYDLGDTGEVLLIKNNRPCPNPKEIDDIHKGMFDFVDKYTRYTQLFKKYVTISPYVAYLPFSKVLNCNDYNLKGYGNFSYDPVIFQGGISTTELFKDSFRKIKNNPSKGKSILLVSHSFSHTGAPHSLLRICKVLLDLDYYCEVWSPHTGSMSKEFEKLGVPIKLVDSHELYDNEVVSEIKKFDLAIVNTILMYDFYRKISKYIPAIWYVREAKNIPDYCSKTHNRSMFKALRKAEEIYCVSEYAKTYIEKYNKNVIILRNCVEDYYRKEKRTNGKKVRFVQMGSLEKRKGYDIFLDALELLTEEEKKQCEVYFAGQILRNSEAFAKEIIERVDKTQNVSYVGEIRNTSEKIDFISSMDVMVVSSLDESCSLTALEGAMLSKPLIVTENTGAKYMVSEKNGIIVKTGDASSLSAALRYMITKKASLEEMGNSSRKIYEEKASMESHRADISNSVSKKIEEGTTIKSIFKKFFYRVFRENIFLDTSESIFSSLVEFKESKSAYSIFNRLNKNAVFRKMKIMNIYEYMKKERERRQSKKTRKGNHVIVSLTSYPPRIPFLETCIKSLIGQTFKPDLILLYLSKEQFPQMELDLPESLLKTCKNHVKIVWCDDDLKSHKKYYYAMQDYPDSIVITVDDDIKYEKDVLEQLYLGFLQHPNAISCLRAHRITFNENGTISNYKDWIWEDKTLCGRESFQAVPTGCGGVLYPPGSLNENLFNKEDILELCPKTDDLWLKIMSVLNSTPVVLLDCGRKFENIDGSQDSAISYQNVVSENDISLKQILKKYNDILENITVIDVLRENGFK